MAMKQKLTILSCTLAWTISLFTACGFKPNEVEEYSMDSGNNSNTFTILASGTETIQNQLSDQEKLDHEIKGLCLILSPYLDLENKLFAGEENADFLQKTLLKIENTGEPIPVSDWEKAIRIIFSFENKDHLSVNMYISDFEENGVIERQYAVSGLMKLLTLRYPDLTLESNYDNVKKSEIIPDLDDISDPYQILIRQAYCLGFADITVDSERLFRPQSPLNSGEAVSIGLPQTAHEDYLKASHTALLSSAPNTSVESFEIFSLEDITTEYDIYLSNLKKLNNSTARKKLDLLRTAESIIYCGSENEIYDENLALEQWRQILHEIFGIEPEKIEPHLCYETNGTLPYDVAAISIFTLLETDKSNVAKDANSEELENARNVIPQFDTARDKSKFAQMFSSGLLDGLYQIPGFTPQRPVNKAEALLVVKRLIQKMSI
jgi:hypothetical protein